MNKVEGHQVDYGVYFHMGGLDYLRVCYICNSKNNSVNKWKRYIQNLTLIKIAFLN